MKKLFEKLGKAFDGAAGGIQQSITGAVGPLVGNATVKWGRTEARPHIEEGPVIRR